LNVHNKPGALNNLYPSRHLCYNPLRSIPKRAHALNTVPTLVPAFDNQDEVFSSAFLILKTAISARALPAASIAVTHRDRLVALKSFGHFTYQSDSEGAPHLSRSSRQEPALSLPKGGDVDSGAVTPSTLFDLASLTKPVATTTMAMLLYERGLLELEAPIIGIVPEFMADDCGEPDPRRRDVTFRMLLSHSSGLPAYEKLFLKAHSRDDLLRAAFTTSLSTDPGTHAEYSDIGFMVLGAALERIARESIDIFCQREIFGSLRMSHTTFNPPIDTRGKIPPTADERDEREQECGAGAPAHETPGSAVPPSVKPPARSTFRKRIIQGEVQDENAFVLGGIAPHAGLFSSAEDLAGFAHAMLNGGHPILRPETIALFTRRESTPPGTSRTLGWDTPSAPSQAGEYFGSRSFGHLGYTGTSLWIDPDRQLSITLLTNRTWPDCANQAIKQVRPKFHDAVVEALG
jgi:CubicO group peptidase (beta-lactamase class C family)